MASARGCLPRTAARFWRAAAQRAAHVFPTDWAGGVLPLFHGFIQKVNIAWDNPLSLSGHCRLARLYSLEALAFGLPWGRFPICLFEMDFLQAMEGVGCRRLAWPQFR